MATQHSKTIDELRSELQDLRVRLQQSGDGGEPARFDSVAMMATAMAHEVSNLMSTVLGNAERLEKHGQADPESQLRLQRIKTAAKRAGNLSNELLAFIRPGRKTTDTLSINPIVCRVLLVEEHDLAPRIRIVRNVDPDLRDVHGDKAQLSQLIMNLAINAVEAVGDEGRIVMTTRNVHLTPRTVPTGSGLQPGEFVYFCIENSGPAIPADAVDRLFEPDYSTKSPRRGTGLAVVKGIAEGHRGHVHVTGSQAGVTAFHVYLPAASLDAPTAEPPMAPDDLKGTETILVIDDDEAIRDVDRETLEEFGYTPLCARNGREAVETARNHTGPIHLALLDLAMPEMGGSEAFPLLREARPDMKIVVCSGLAKGADSAKLVEAGVDGILTKPYAAGELIRTVRSTLGR